MRSRVYIGHVMHHRQVPVEHRFSYPVQAWCVDLDELPAMDRELGGFGYNRRRPLSIHDADYLRGEGSIRRRLTGVLRSAGVGEEPRRVECLTVPRMFGAVFNPVSFYYCYGDGDVLRCVVAEVNNTFGERHTYVLRQRADGGDGGFPACYRQEKQFHVSPFNDRTGGYELTFTEPAGQIGVTVTLCRGGAQVLTAALTGEAVPMTTRSVWGAFLRRPFSGSMVFPRILWQAAQLYGRRRLPVYAKPPPSNPMTVRAAPPGRFTALCMRAVLDRLSRIRRGRLRMTLPDGSEREFGEGGPSVEWRVWDLRLFRRLVLDGDIGLGEGFTAGEWETPDAAALLGLLVDNIEALGAGARWSEALSRWVHRIRHTLRANTRAGSRRNIQAHYDLGNDFYRTFLDGETWMYSAGIHDGEGEPLAEAQRRKIERILELAAPGPGDHLLEIGCGWGGFAIEAARRTGCRVTGITLSQEQLRLARERVAAAGLSDRIDLRLCDYRDVTGLYDRIVSIEMIEAVGHAYYGAFFRACDRLLAEGGRVVLQAICIPDQRYEAYRRNPDWIQKHIFPGGLLPSLSALLTAMVNHTRLGVERVENIGPHYALTLRAWRERFVAAADELERLGYDETFRRTWIYYLAYCEAGFAARYIDDLHIVLRRPGRG